MRHQQGQRRCHQCNPRRHEPRPLRCHRHQESRYRQLPQHRPPRPQVRRRQGPPYLRRPRRRGERPPRQQRSCRRKPRCRRLIAARCRRRSGGWGMTRGQWTGATLNVRHRSPPCGEVPSLTPYPTEGFLQFACSPPEAGAECATCRSIGADPGLPAAIVGNSVDRHLLARQQTVWITREDDAMPKAPARRGHARGLSSPAERDAGKPDGWQGCDLGIGRRGDRAGGIR